MVEKRTATVRLRLKGGPVQPIEGARAAGPRRDGRTGRERRVDRSYGIGPDASQNKTSAGTTHEQKPDETAAPLPEVVQRGRSFLSVPDGLTAFLPENSRRKNS